MGHIFISYARKDTDFVNELKLQLENNNYDVWVDFDRLQPGKDWRLDIDEAIESSLAMIVVLSPRASDSKYVTYEWAFALGNKISVIPLMLEACDIHPRLETLQYMDFTNPWKSPWDKLLIYLSDVGKNHTTSSPPIPIDFPEDLKKAIIAVESWNPNERQQAFETIAKHDDPAINDVLKWFSLNSARNDIREMSLWALAKLKDTTVVPYFLEILKTGDNSIRAKAVYALGEIGDTSTIPDLAKVLHLRIDSHLRSAAAWALGQTKSESSLTNLIKSIDDNDKLVRSSVIKAIGEIRSPNAVPTLLSRLSAEDIHCSEMVIALGKIGDNNAIPRLLDLLQYSDSRLVWDITTALANIGEDSIDGLLNALTFEGIYKTKINGNSPFTGNDQIVRQAIVSALVKISEKPAVKGLIAFLENDMYNQFWMKTVKVIVAEGLLDIGTEEALSAVETWKMNNQKSES